MNLLESSFEFISSCFCSHYPLLLVTSPPFVRGTTPLLIESHRNFQIKSRASNTKSSNINSIHTINAPMFSPKILRIFGFLDGQQLLSPRTSRFLAFKHSCLGSEQSIGSTYPWCTAGTRDQFCWENRYETHSNYRGLQILAF